MKTCLAWLLALALPAASAQPLPTDSAEGVARNLLRIALTAPLYGLPRAERDAELQPLLSQDLRAALLAAREHEAALAKVYGEEKPPLIEHMLLLPSGEGDLEGQLSTFQPSGEGTGEYQVQYASIDARQPRGHAFRVLFFEARWLLRRQPDGQWRVDDVCEAQSCLRAQLDEYLALPLTYEPG